MFKESLDEPSILSELNTLFGELKNERLNGETFGDFTNRKYFNSKDN
jgi:sulfite reductase beta subunit-like hemoprotein